VTRRLRRTGVPAHDLLAAARARAHVRHRGLLPFLAPRLWRETFRRLTEMGDGQIRFIGLSAMVIRRAAARGGELRRAAAC